MEGKEGREGMEGGKGGKEGRLMLKQHIQYDPGSSDPSEKIL